MTSKAKVMEAMQKEAAEEQAAADTAATQPDETPMERMQREALEEQAAVDGGNTTAASMEAMQKEAAEEQAATDAAATQTDETPMERMQREALEEQATADGGSAAAISMEAMQQAALSEQASSDTAVRSSTNLRDILNHYLFDMNTRGGKIANYSVLTLVVGTVFVSMLNSVSEIHHTWGEKIVSLQMGILYVFLIEYLLRIYAARDRKKYLLGFYGIIDFVTVLPLLFGNPGSAIMRLCRLFRILHLGTYFPVLATLLRSIAGTANMILAVLATILAVSVFSGNLAYIFEPETFKNAFIGTWWSLVTMSTVGYGDLVPHSPEGMVLGGVLILIGLCVVAMMTAVIAVRVGRMANMTNKCFECEKPVSSEFSFCPYCGQDQSDEIDLFTDDE